MSFREFLYSLIFAHRKSGFGKLLFLLNGVFFIGLFIDPVTGVLGTLLTLMMQAMNLLIGIKNIEIEELKGEIVHE